MKLLRSPSLLAFLLFALLIFACSSTPKVPSGPPPEYEEPPPPSWLKEAGAAPTEVDAAVVPAVVPGS